MTPKETKYLLLVLSPMVIGGAFLAGFASHAAMNPPRVEYVTEYVDRPLTVTEYIDRPFPVEVVKEVETIREVEVIKEVPVEVEKIVYRNQILQEWQSVEQFEEWYRAQGFTLLFNPPERSDCDDYAEWVRRTALKQAYSISDALVWNGRYYNKQVTEFVPNQPGHAGSLVLIQGTYYYFEPEILKFNGLVKVIERD